MKRLNITILPLLLLGAILLNACGKKQKKENDKTHDTVSKSKVDSLRQAYSRITSNLDSSWDSMMVSDNHKIKDMKRLIKEVKFAYEDSEKAFNKAKHDTLKQKVKKLKQIRYDSFSMAKPNAIDRYDSMTKSVSKSVINYARNHPDYEKYSLMKKLTKSIKEANNEVLMNRVRYDDYAMDYNEFLEKHKPIISRIDTTPSEVKKRPLFQLKGN